MPASIINSMCRAVASGANEPSSANSVVDAGNTPAHLLCIASFLLLACHLCDSDLIVKSPFGGEVLREPAAHQRGPNHLHGHGAQPHHRIVKLPIRHLTGV